MPHILVIFVTQYTPCDTHYTLHTTHYTLHTTHYTLHTAHYTLHTTHYTLHTTHYTLHTTHYTLHTTHYTLHTTHYTLHTTHYTLHTTHHKQNNIITRSQCENLTKRLQAINVIGITTVSPQIPSRMEIAMISSWFLAVVCNLLLLICEDICCVTMDLVVYSNGVKNEGSAFDTAP